MYGTVFLHLSISQGVFVDDYSFGTTDLCFLQSSFFWFCRYSPTWYVYAQNDILWHLLKLINMQPICVKIISSFILFGRGVPSCETYCPSGVWCFGSSTYRMYISPVFGTSFKRQYNVKENAILPLFALLFKHIHLHIYLISVDTWIHVHVPNTCLIFDL